MEGPRGARREELGHVVDLADAVFSHPMGWPPIMGSSFPLLFDESNVDNLRIMADGKKPVSLAGMYKCPAVFYGCELDVVLIGSVCTLPEYRGEGLATALMEDSIRKSREDGVDLMLVSGERGLYRRLGCAQVGRVFDLKMSSEELANVESEGIDLAPYQGSELHVVAAIHRGEPVRFRRGLEDFEKLMSIEDVASICTRKKFLVRSDGDVVGYLVAEEKGLAEWFPAQARVGEHAGARWPIIRALKLLLETIDCGEIMLSIPGWDTSLISLLRKSGLSLPPPRAFDGTVRIINFPQFMGRMCRYIEERVGKKVVARLSFEEREEEFAIALEDDRIAIQNVADLTKLVFGTPDGSEDRMLPPKSRLGAVLKRIFPLPTLTYGLNYT